MNVIVIFCAGAVSQLETWDYKPELIAQDVHPLYDFNATILHLLGLDHEQLTFQHNGIDRRLTNVEGHIIDEILA